MQICHLRCTIKSWTSFTGQIRQITQSVAIQNPVGPQGNKTGPKWNIKLRFTRLVDESPNWLIRLRHDFQLLGWSPILPKNSAFQGLQSLFGKRPSSQWCWDPARELRAPRREKRGACRTCRRAWPPGNPVFQGVEWLKKERKHAGNITIPGLEPWQSSTITIEFNMVFIGLSRWIGQVVPWNIMKPNLGGKYRKVSPASGNLYPANSE